jgi:hypothetical protein
VMCRLGGAWTWLARKCECGAVKHGETTCLRKEVMKMFLETRFSGKDAINRKNLRTRICKDLFIAVKVFLYFRTFCTGFYFTSL